MWNSNRVAIAARIAGGFVVLSGLVALVLAPLFGSSMSEKLWGVEPLTYIGASLLIVGLAAIALSFVAVHGVLQPRPAAGPDPGSDSAPTDLIQQYFELYHHDLGRPLARILAKERELRAVLASRSRGDDPSLTALLDEIETQAPNFRLMLSNIQVLVQLETPFSPDGVQAVEPAEVVRRIVDRYTPVAGESKKEITWWSEPAEFGIVHCDSSAIEHIVTNLVDNAVRYATDHIEVRLSRNPTHLLLRVWDDGPGIASQYLPHPFDRGWTPEVARRDEKTSSGLGLFIAKTLAGRYGGDLAVESVTGPEADHHTAFLASLALPPAPSAAGPERPETGS